MKRIELAVTAAVFLLFSAITSSATITLDFSSSPGATLAFGGMSLGAGNFGFTASSTPPAQFHIVSSSSDGSAEVGDTGYITPTFTIGTITGSGSQTAPVTGTGTLTINDGTPNLFTATISWFIIQSQSTQVKLNPGLAVNLSNIQYSGSQPDLRSLATIGTATDYLTATFVPAVNLSTLDGGATYSTTSWSGTITAVPEQSTSLAAAFLGLLLASSAIWNFRKNQLA